MAHVEGSWCTLVALVDMEVFKSPTFQLPYVLQSSRIFLAPVASLVAHESPYAALAVIETLSPLLTILFLMSNTGSRAHRHR